MTITPAVVVVQRYMSGHQADTLAPDATMTDHALGMTHEGSETIGAAMRMMYEETFPGAVARTRHLSGGTDAATLQFTFCGNHQGPLGPLPPTGNDVEVDMCAVYRVDGDHITSIDLYYDQATMIRQLTGA